MMVWVHELLKGNWLHLWLYQTASRQSVEQTNLWLSLSGVYLCEYTGDAQICVFVASLNKQSDGTQMGMPDCPIPVGTILCFFIMVSLKKTVLLHSSFMRSRPFLNIFWHKHQKLPRKPDKEGKNDELAVGKECFSKCVNDLIAYFSHI